MLQRLELRDVGPAPRLALDFAPRLNLITGDNGVGKSFILEVAWWAMTRTWAGLPAAPRRDSEADPSITFRFEAERKIVSHTSTYVAAQQAWTPKRGRPPNPGMVLFARADGSFSVWDPARNYWKSAPSRGIDEPERPAAYHFDSTQVWNGLEPSGKILCNGLIRDWATWQGRNGQPFEQLLHALEALSPSEGETLVPGELTRISLDDVRDMPTIRTPYDEVPVVHASAGVRRVLALAYLLVWTWQEHVQASRLLRQEPTKRIVFLIDEIEAHLHPRWQRTILRSLLRVMSALTGDEGVEVQVLAVTHSPLLLASLEPLFDQGRDALFHIEVRGREVVLESVAWRRRGDANTWLISDLFDLKEPRSLEAERAIVRAEDMMRSSRADAPRADAIAELHRDLQASLPDVDPFWVRWRYWRRLVEAESA
jgi:hypothetical protein